MENETSTQHFIVDLSADTGAIKHSATGFLYGLGQDSIPSVNMLAALKPQVVAQKPEDGLQHPNGDALNVANFSTSHHPYLSANRRSKSNESKGYVYCAGGQHSVQVSRSG
jgi:hypothetical protein